MEDIVNQTPYTLSLRYPKVIGTINKEQHNPTAFNIPDNRILFLSIKVRSLSVLNIFPKSINNFLTAPYFIRLAIVMSIVAMDAVLEPMDTISAVVIFLAASLLGTIISQPGMGLVR